MLVETEEACPLLTPRPVDDRAGCDVFVPSFRQRAIAMVAPFVGNVSCLRVMAFNAIRPQPVRQVIMVVGSEHFLHCGPAFAGPRPGPGLAAPRTAAGSGPCSITWT